MELRHHQIVTGERLQALAQRTIITRGIHAFHKSIGNFVDPEKLVFLDEDRGFLDRLRGQRTLFVYTHLLDAFFERIYPRLGDTMTLVDVMGQAVTKDKWVYGNVSLATNIPERARLMKALLQKNLAALPRAKPFREYLRELASHRFCAAPAGNGVDTHRLHDDGQVVDEAIAPMMLAEGPDHSHVVQAA